MFNALPFLIVKFSIFIFVMIFSLLSLEIKTTIPLLLPFIIVLVLDSPINVI